MDRRKLYIDSRYRASGSPSNFEYELPETVELPKNTRAFITEFTSVNNWDTISQSNNQMYVVEELDIATQVPRVLTITQNPYDTDRLRAAIEGQLHNSSN